MHILRLVVVMAGGRCRESYNVARQLTQITPSTHWVIGWQLKRINGSCNLQQ